uniref:Uncharacterized protein n=1 Tax=Sphenodon punctatus TaxID=8508 RepID=A0A8D0L7K5_SPHPU
MNVPQAPEEEEIVHRKSFMEEILLEKSLVEVAHRKSAAETVLSQQSTMEIAQRKSVFEETLQKKIGAYQICRKSTQDESLGQLSTEEEEEEEEEVFPSEWNLSFEDFKQALLLVPEEEEREAALAQLNKAALELCVVPRPTQSDLLYQTWYVPTEGKNPPTSILAQLGLHWKPPNLFQRAGNWL